MPPPKSPATLPGFSIADAMTYDLFGQVPITEDDLFLWVQAVAPRWLTPERAYRNYVKSWNVADKVRYAKIDGTFDTIIERPARVWHARLSLATII